MLKCKVCSNLDQHIQKQTHLYKWLKKAYKLDWRKTHEENMQKKEEKKEKQNSPKQYRKKTWATQGSFQNFQLKSCQSKTFTLLRLS